LEPARARARRRGRGYRTACTPFSASRGRRRPFTLHRLMARYSSRNWRAVVSRLSFAAGVEGVSRRSRIL
jgi:hypothetical protein